MCLGGFLEFLHFDFIFAGQEQILSTFQHLLFDLKIVYQCVVQLGLIMTIMRCFCLQQVLIPGFGFGPILRHVLRACVEV